MRNLHLKPLITLLFCCFNTVFAPCLYAQTPQQTKEDQKQVRRQAELARKAAEQQRKQEIKDQKETEKMRDRVSTNGVGERARIELRLRDSTRVKGWVSQMTMVDFTLNDAATGRARVIRYRDVVEAKGKNPAAGKKGKSTAETVLSILGE